MFCGKHQHIKIIKKQKKTLINDCNKDLYVTARLDIEKYNDFCSDYYFQQQQQQQQCLENYETNPGNPIIYTQPQLSCSPMDCANIVSPNNNNNNTEINVGYKLQLSDNNNSSDSSRDIDSGNNSTFVMPTQRSTTAKTVNTETNTEITNTTRLSSMSALQIKQPQQQQQQQQQQYELSFFFVCFILCVCFFLPFAKNHTCQPNDTYETHT